MIDVIPNSEQWLSINNLPKEEWKDIDGYNGLYQISNYGRVKSFFTRQAKILRCSFDKRGYTRTTLVKDGVCKYYRINVLVAKHFIPNTNPMRNTLVLHKQPVTILYCNNKCDNLYWGNSTDNNRDTVRQKRGNGYPIVQRDTNLKLIARYNSCREAGRKTNLKHEYIASACRGERKQYAGYIWKYEEA